MTSYSVSTLPSKQMAVIFFASLASLSFLAQKLIVEPDHIKSSTKRRFSDFFLGYVSRFYKFV